MFNVWQACNSNKISSAKKTIKRRLPDNKFVILHKGSKRK